MDEIPENFCIPNVVPVSKCKNSLPAPPGTNVISTQNSIGFDSVTLTVRSWVQLRKAEKDGVIQFSVVINEGKRKTLELLLALRNAIHEQQPNMDQPYITRLIFDAKHESVLLRKKNENGNHDVVGGCC